MSTATPEYESLQTAADRTDFSTWTLRDLIAEGKLPAYRMTDKPRSAIRVKRADVDALMKPVIPPQVYGHADAGKGSKGGAA